MCALRHFGRMYRVLRDVDGFKINYSAVSGVHLTATPQRPRTHARAQFGSCWRCHYMYVRLIYRGSKGSSRWFMGAFDLFRVRARFLCCAVSSPAAAAATLWRAKLRVIYAKGQMDFLGKSSSAECSKCHHRLGLVHPSNCVCKKRVQFLASKKCTALARINQPWNFENWKYVNAKKAFPQ